MFITGDNIAFATFKNSKMDHSDKINTAEKNDNRINAQTSTQVQQTQDSIKATLEKSKKLSLNLKNLSSRWEVMNSTMNTLNEMFLNAVLPQYDTLKYELGDANGGILENAIDMSLKKYDITNNNSNIENLDASWVMNYVQKKEEDELRKGIEMSLSESAVHNVNNNNNVKNTSNNGNIESSPEAIDFSECGLTDEDAIAFAKCLELSKINNNNNSLDPNEEDRLLQLALEMSMNGMENEHGNMHEEEEETIYEGVVESKC